VVASKCVSVCLMCACEGVCYVCVLCVWECTMCSCVLVCERERQREYVCSVLLSFVISLSIARTRIPSLFYTLLLPLPGSTSLSHSLSRSLACIHAYAHTQIPSRPPPPPPPNPPTTPHTHAHTHTDLCVHTQSFPFSSSH